MAELKQFNTLARQIAQQSSKKTDMLGATPLHKAQVAQWLSYASGADDLEPHLKAAPPSAEVQFVGHSLGGSTSIIMRALLALKLGYTSANVAAEPSGSAAPRATFRPTR